jgi:plastocyanin
MHRSTRMIHALALLAAPALLATPLIGVQAAIPRVPHVQPHATVQVAIQNFAFSPQTLMVAPGTTVVWTQKDSAPHTVTSDTGAWTASADLHAGQTFSHTFTKAGTFAYHCAVHPNMTATIVVASHGATGGTGSGTGGGSPAGAGIASLGPVGKTTMTTWIGYYDNKQATYIMTDTSNKAEATRDHINYAPSLATSLAHAVPMYVITNGTYAARGPVFGSWPGESGYTPLWQEVSVTWKDPSQAVALGQDNQIEDLAKAGKLTLTMTGIVLNAPIIREGAAADDKGHGGHGGGSDG